MNGAISNLFLDQQSVHLKMANYVKVRMAENILKIKSSALNVANLAIIFKLDSRQGIYIHSDESEIILPDSMGSSIT